MRYTRQDVDTVYIKLKQVNINSNSVRSYLSFMQLEVCYPEWKYIDFLDVDTMNKIMNVYGVAPRHIIVDVS